MYIHYPIISQASCMDVLQSLHLPYLPQWVEKFSEVVFLFFLICETRIRNVHWFKTGPNIFLETRIEPFMRTFISFQNISKIYFNMSTFWLKLRMLNETFFVWRIWRKNQIYVIVFCSKNFSKLCQTWNLEFFRNQNSLRTQILQDLCCHSFY